MRSRALYGVLAALVTACSSAPDIELQRDRLISCVEPVGYERVEPETLNQLRTEYIVRGKVIDEYERRVERCSRLEDK